MVPIQLNNNAPIGSFETATAVDTNKQVDVATVVTTRPYKELLDALLIDEEAEWVDPPAIPDVIHRFVCLVQSQVWGLLRVHTASTTEGLAAMMDASDADSGEMGVWDLETGKPMLARVQYQIYTTNERRSLQGVTTSPIQFEPAQRVRALASDLRAAANALEAAAGSDNQMRHAVDPWMLANKALADYNLWGHEYRGPVVPPEVL